MEPDDRNGESAFLPDEELTSVQVPQGLAVSVTLC
jgi:hypothetical protein